MFAPLIAEIRRFRKVAVVSHLKPDGDCIGAQVALCRWLAHQGIEYKAFNEDYIPDTLAWMLKGVPVDTLSWSSLIDVQAVIFCDGNAKKRFSTQPEKSLVTTGKFTVVIDHHPDPDTSFDLVLSKVSASSTCEMVYELYQESGIDPVAAGAAHVLFAGIMTDTGSFQFDSVSPRTMEIAKRLMEDGDFRPNVVAEKVFSSKTYESLKMLGTALASLKSMMGGRVAVMSLSYDTLMRYDEDLVDTDGFVNHALSMKGVKVALFFKESEPGAVKISLRSKSDIDVNLWARELDGGGHKKAAGAFYPGPVQDAIERTLAVGARLYPDEFSK